MFPTKNVFSVYYCWVALYALCMFPNGREALTMMVVSDKSPIINARWEQHTSLSTPTPPRSGHVAFHLGSKAYIFGGYAEETPTNRYVVNDLWKFSFESGWKQVEYQNDNHRQSITPRLASAAATLKGRAFLFGGWDPQIPGTGGEILKDVVSFEFQEEEEDAIRVDPTSFPPFPNGPTSRHVAVTLDPDTIWIHDFRCTDYVWLFSQEKKQWKQQPVTGTAPSSRGLHCACVLSDGKTKYVLLFGGADKQQGMSDETFLFNTDTWEWTPIKSPNGPAARAGASLASLSNQRGALLFGGAKPDNGALQGLNDLWYFSMETQTWTEIQIKDTSSIPPGRNAASLTLLCQEAEEETSEEDVFLLCGGWQPFVETHDDVWTLHISKSN